MNLISKYGLSIKQKPAFSSNGKSIQFIDETLVRDGNDFPVDDYGAWAQLEIKNSNGKLFAIYHIGSDHGQTHNAKLAFTTSTDHGYTWTAEYTLKHNGQSSPWFGNVGGPALHYNQTTGRLTAFCNGPRYFSTSVTAVNLATAVAPLVVNIGAGHTIPNGMGISFLSRANSDNRFRGTVTAYNSGTGDVTLDPILKEGTGTISDWDVMETVRQMFMYSDDEGITWTDPILLDESFVTPWAYGMPGNAIQYGSTILKPVYGTDVGVSDYAGWLYRSTDNAVTWERWNTMYPAGQLVPDDTQSPNLEEPQLMIRGDGLLLSIHRSDPLHKTYVRYHLNGGDVSISPWSTFFNAFPSIGGNALAVSPNGTIVGIGRLYDAVQSNQRPLVTSSFDGGKTWAYQNADSNIGQQEYGGVVWSQVAGYFILFYIVEKGTAFTGPTWAICKRVAEV